MQIAFLHALKLAWAGPAVFQPVARAAFGLCILRRQRPPQLAPGR